MTPSPHEHLSLELLALKPQRCLCQERLASIGLGPSVLGCDSVLGRAMKKLRQITGKVSTRHENSKQVHAQASHQVGQIRLDLLHAVASNSCAESRHGFLDLLLPDMIWTRPESSEGHKNFENLKASHTGNIIATRIRSPRLVALKSRSLMDGGKPAVNQKA